mgnify:CR=1 FL=1|tara:strand:+ start:395 stop:1057 length:663 start_codon:yes stop_codon:yes gene_type:complete
MNTLFLIWSNFSKHCEKAIKLANEIGDINTLCIDNKKVRQRVISNKSLNISVVPTIILQTNNSFKKIEGNEAISLLANIYNRKNNHIIQEQQEIQRLQQAQRLQQVGQVGQVGQQVQQVGQAVQQVGQVVQQVGQVEQQEQEEPKRKGVTDINSIQTDNEEDEEEEESEIAKNTRRRFMTTSKEGQKDEITKQIKKMQEKDDISKKVEEMRRERAIISSG